MSASTLFSQSTLIATLSHDGQFSSFYGTNAFIEAYNAAREGDIITLSSGYFAANDIKKNLTIRGAGMILDQNPTVLTGITKFEASNSETNSLTIEGVRFHPGNSNIFVYASSVRFLKCDLGYVVNSGSNNTYIHCNIGNLSLSSYNYIDGSCRFVNCVLNKFKSDNDKYNVSFDNSIVTLAPGSTGEISREYYCHLRGCTLKNCVIKQIEDNGKTAPITSVFINCVAISPNSNFFGNCQKSNCKRIEADVDPFTSDGFYILKSQYASEWLGSDGKEIGIYGGNLPFDPMTSNPHIKKFNVAPKTTADGKLSVDIEVSID